MSHTHNAKAAVLPQRFKRTFAYRGTDMVDADIRYPQIRLHRSPEIEKRINTHYRFVAVNFLRYVSAKVYPEAVAAWRQAQKNGYPFHTYEADMQYIVTVNQDCRFGTYTDRYEYLGGAHGTTQRSSASWDLRTGRILKAADILGTPYPKPKVLAEILKLADRNYAENPGIYFENYRELIAENLDLKNFYLTPEGPVFYFQQYDIAPYASGIPEFPLSYESLGVSPPSCRN